MSSPLPPLQAIDEKAFAECLRCLTILPRRADDELTGALRVRIYRSVLGQMSKVQFWWTVERAIERCQWFPSVKELREISDEWTRRDDAALALSTARAIARRHSDAEIFDIRGRLKTERCDQAWIDALPLETREMLVTERLLYRCPTCRTHTQRPGWQDWQDFIAGQEKDNENG